MKISGTIQDSIVDGPGLRFAVFTQGCDVGCEGCQNPGAISPSGGIEMTLDQIISEMSSNPLTDGLTLTGGEPFMQAADCSQLAAAAHEIGLNVWTYTGNTFSELIEKSKNDPNIMELLQNTDVLVDGRFEIKERTLSLKWRGSKNQRIIDVPKTLAENEVVELELQ